MGTWTERFTESTETEVRPVPPERRMHKPGMTMVMPSAQAIDRRVRAIACGETITRKSLREELAEEYGATISCPVTTARMMQVVAEHAIEQLDAGADPAEVTPFWRAMDPDASESRRLTRGADFVRQMRDAERG